MRRCTLVFICFIAGLIISCSSKHETVMPPLNTVIITKWGHVDGKPVFLYTLKNKQGSMVKITNYGGILTSWLTSDKQEKFADIVMGFDNLDQYLEGPPYFGATIGRYANRIAKGKFSIDDVPYSLATNNDGNHLHGGIKGFDKVVWDASVDDTIPNTLHLSYLSKHLEEGYPGNLTVKVTYTFTDDDELIIGYTATTDRPTVVNLCNHSYFNLSGDYSKTILEHEMRLQADNYTPSDSLIPTGKIQSVKNTPFDFITWHTIGSRIDEADGYDLNYVLNNSDAQFPLVAEVIDSASGRKLEVFTTEPGIQFYSAIHLDKSLIGSDGLPFMKYGAFCLETQHYPDSPNKPNFPTTILRPGETFTSKTSYKVFVMK